MLSSDKNVETLTQLIELMKHNFELRTEFTKLEIVDKVVRLLSAATLAVLLSFVFIAAMLFASLAAAWWLSSYVGATASLLCVSAFYALLLLACYVFRKSWIERPLVSFLANLLLS